MMEKIVKTDEARTIFSIVFLFLRSFFTIVSGESLYAFRSIINAQALNISSSVNGFSAIL